MDYPLGNAITLREKFSVSTEVDGDDVLVPTDPTTVVVHVLWPDGSEHTYTSPDVTNPAVGVYELVLDPTVYVLLGTYIYWAVGTGAVDATSKPRSFRIIAQLAGDGQWGPCELWITAEDVEEVCSASESSQDFQEAVEIAVSGLFKLVPRYSGTCGPTRVRPCERQQCGRSWASPGAWEWGGNDWLQPIGGPWLAGLDANDFGCSCTARSRVRLSGHVRDVLEVTIDGAVIDPDAYRVDQAEWLTRIDGDRWPSCQDETADHTEDGTFSVLYTFGVDPPPEARAAARELACAVFQTIQSDNSANAEDCPLPNNVTRIDREGITIDLKSFTGWGFDPVKKQWQTGLPLVDYFLNTNNPAGRRRRRASAWSPDMQPPARRLGP